MTQQNSLPDKEIIEQEDRRFLIPVWVWIAAAAVTGTFAVTLWQSRRLTSQLAELRKQIHQGQSHKETLEAERQNFEQIRALLGAPETREIRLKAESADLAMARAFWNEDLGVVLAAEQMPAPPADRTYQLWIVQKNGSPIRAGVFQPDGNGKVLQLLRVEANVSAKDAKGLAISEEPAGGSPQPTTPFQWVGIVR